MPTPTSVYPYIERTPPQTLCTTDISIVNEDCLVVAESMTRKYGSSCVLNMANQFEVGGDYLNICKLGQEESLIKRTNLLDSLIQLDGVRKGNASNPYQYALTSGHGIGPDDQNKGFGELTCLYSPNITVTHLDTDTMTPVEPFLINIISSAAYNLADHSASLTRELWLAGTVLKVINQLRTAKANGQRHFILGAFGCGAFFNDPVEMAEIYYAAIHEYEFQGCFDSICFAIKKTHSNENYEAFMNVFYTSDYKPLMNVLSPVFAMMSSHPKLIKKMDPFSTIDSQDELSYLLSNLIKSEILSSRVSHSESKKIQFLKHIFMLLQDSTYHARSILHTVVCHSEIKMYYPTSLFFKITPGFLIKLQDILERSPLVFPPLTAQQIRLTDALCVAHLLPKVNQIMSCFTSDEDKEVACFLLYLSVKKEPQILNRELNHRFQSDTSTICQLLMGINAICTANCDDDLKIDEIVRLGDSNHTPNKNVTKILGDYISMRMEIFLAIHYRIYFNISRFEEAMMRNADEHATQLNA